MQILYSTLFLASSSTSRMWRGDTRRGADATADRAVSVSVTDTQAMSDRKDGVPGDKLVREVSGVA